MKQIIIFHPILTLNLNSPHQYLSDFLENKSSRVNQDLEELGPQWTGLSVVADYFIIEV